MKLEETRRQLKFHPSAGHGGGEHRGSSLYSLAGTKGSGLWLGQGVHGRTGLLRSAQVDEELYRRFSNSKKWESCWLGRSLGTWGWSSGWHKGISGANVLCPDKSFPVLALQTKDEGPTDPQLLVEPFLCRAAGVIAPSPQFFLLWAHLIWSLLTLCCFCCSEDMMSSISPSHPCSPGWSSVWELSEMEFE